MEIFFCFENQEKELFLVDNTNTNTKRLLMKEQIEDCGEETQPTDLGVAATRNGKKKFCFFFLKIKKRNSFWLIAQTQRDY